MRFERDSRRRPNSFVICTCRITHSFTHSLKLKHERQRHRYVSFRHDTFRKHAMRRCWSFIILPCRSRDDEIEICVLTKAQNKFWHGRDPIEATPRSKDALKLSCFGPECKSRACQFFGFGMCRRVSCSFEHVRTIMFERMSMILSTILCSISFISLCLWSLTHANAHTHTHTRT